MSQRVAGGDVSVIVYRAGTFELDASRCEIRRDGARLPVQRKVLDLILYLAEHRERVVPRLELAQHLWADVTVSEASLGTVIKEARQVLGDDGQTQRFILTIRGRGFRWVAETEMSSVPPSKSTAPAGAPPPPPPATVARATTHPTRSLVGRRAELDGFDALLEEKSGDSHNDDNMRRSRLLLIVGEAGIGKTRLADALCASARQRGYGVATAHCDELEGAPAHRPWQKLLRAMSLPSRLDSGSLAAKTEESSRSSSDSSDSIMLRPEEARFRLFEDIAESVRERVKAGQPWLLFLDDLHATDAFTLALTVFLARELEDSPVILVASWRDPELAPDDPKQRWLLELRRTSTCVPIDLTGLSLEETAELVRRMAPRATDPFIEALHSESAGNPFFIEEVVRAVLRDPSPAYAWDHARIAQVRSAALDAMLRQRLARLDAMSRRLLDAACILGQEFSTHLAETVAELPPAECNNAWDALEDAGIVRAATLPPPPSAPLSQLQSQETRLAFSHGLVRASLEADLPRQTRVALHRRAAEVLQEQAPLSRHEWVSELAHHCRQGAPLISVKHAVAVSRDAARDAAKRFAFEDAERHLAAAIALLERGSSISPRAADDLNDRDNDEHGKRAELYLELGEVQLAAGAYMTSRASFLEAMRLARLARRADLLAQGALGIGRPLEHILQPVSDTVLVDSIREALAAASENDVAVRVRLLSRMAIARHTTLSDPEGVELADQAVALAKTTGDADLEAYAQLARYWGLWGQYRLEKTLECTTLMAELGDRAVSGHSSHRHGDTGHLGAWYSMVHGATLLGFGRIDEARLQLRKQAEHVARTRRPHARAFVCMFEAMLALVEWKPDVVERAMNEWFSIATRLGDEVLARILFLVQLWPLRKQQGRAGELVPIQRQALAGWPSIGTRSMLASCLYDAGEIDEARRVYMTALEDIESLPEDRAAYYLVLNSLPELARAFSDVETARRLQAVFERTDGTHVVHPPGYQGPVARHLAVIAATMGEKERARDLLREAKGHAEAVGARWWEQRIDADLAGLLRS